MIKHEKHEAEQTGQAARDTASSAAIEPESSVVMMAHDVLKETISATEDVGSGLIGGVTHLAKDIVHGVQDVGDETVQTLTHLLAGVVGGVRQVASAAVVGAKKTASKP